MKFTGQIIKASIFPLLLILTLAFPAFAAQTDITGPAGSGAFGSSVTVLPNGNIVVTDPNYSIPSGAAKVGAVYLYDGATLALISTVTGSTAQDRVGSGSVTVLTNGNYVVRSQFWDNPSTGIADVGAVTFGNGTTGISGVVSVSNSLVGSTATNDVGSGGVTALTNGSYVVISENWDNSSPALTDVGAVTFGNGATGISGVVSVSNSLVGSTQFDAVGSGGVTALTNGNYVVRSSGWDNPSPAITDVGAVTFGSGVSGISGTISVSNSLIGSTTSDAVGGVTALTNGNYVVRSSSWDNPSTGIGNVGAVTFGNGTSGTVGAVSSANSLTGSTAGDAVGGNGVTALTNGNYVVGSQNWDNPSTGIADVGAVTFGNGLSGISGIISASNSLVGSTAGDTIGSTGLSALTNGSYVVRSRNWDNSSTADVGAVTFGNGATGISGVVSVSNSLTGSTTGDSVGSGGVTALTNGNYVVSSSSWDNLSPAITDVGAVTFGSGTTGISGAVSSANSLIGSTANDQVGLLIGSTANNFFGSNGVTALTNGNYVVGSLGWDNPSPAIVNVGAATFGNGTTGISGTISASNSLIGSTVNDQVGTNGVTALTNGNYVVNSSIWDNSSPAITNVGAVTFGSGTTGISGAVSSANSLVGSTADDQVGVLISSAEGPQFRTNGVTALTNGNYVVGSSSWDNPSTGIGDAGAVTFGSGATGISGAVSSANSLVGSAVGDRVGNSSMTVLTNGNYVVNSPEWSNLSPRVGNAGAVTFGNGTSGTVGAITNGAGGGNSVVGTVTNGINTFAFDATRNRLFVGRSASSIVSVLFFETTATSDGAINSAATFDNGLPNGLVNAVIPNGRTVSLRGISNIGQVQVDCTATLTRASSANYIVGSVRRNFCGTPNDSFVYPIGDANNYSPLTASNVNGTGALTAAVTDNFLTGLPQGKSLSRYWSLTGAGITTKLTFNYVDADVNGAESAYRAFKRSGSTNLTVPVNPSTVDAAANTFTATGVSRFSDWSAGEPPLSPETTAAGVSIAGRVTTTNGRGLVNAFVTLTNANGKTRTMRTSAFGYYRFDDVAAGQILIAQVVSKRYQFAPQIVTVNEDLMGLIFAQLP